MAQKTKAKEVIVGKSTTIYSFRPIIQIWKDRDLAVLVDAAEEYFGRPYSEIMAKSNYHDLADMRRMICAAACKVWKISQRHYSSIAGNRDRTTVIWATQTHDERKGIPCWDAYNADFNKWLKFLQLFTRRAIR